MFFFLLKIREKHRRQKAAVDTHDFTGLPETPDASVAADHTDASEAAAEYTEQPASVDREAYLLYFIQFFYALKNYMHCGSRNVKGLIYPDPEILRDSYTRIRISTF